MLKRLLKPSAFKLAVLIGVAFASLHFVMQAGGVGGGALDVLELLEQRALDLKFRRRGPIPTSGQVVVVGIDEASLQKFGLWPWNRELVARGIQHLHEAGAAAIGVDIAFTDPDRSSPHLTVNALIDALAARTEALPKGEELRTLADEAPTPLRLKLTALSERIGRGPTEELRTALLAAKLPDPDAEFARRLAESPRTVLGVFGVHGRDTAAIPAEVMARNARAID
ncbi:MAG: CHASE2 domain-containing protein, partial [Myxococcales bacterium]